jgi:hypothetical protein
MFNFKELTREEKADFVHFICDKLETAGVSGFYYTLILIAKEPDEVNLRESSIGSNFPQYEAPDFLQSYGKFLQKELDERLLSN